MTNQLNNNDLGALLSSAIGRDGVSALPDGGFTHTFEFSAAPPGLNVTGVPMRIQMAAPVNWFERLKQRWFPGWLLRLWPYRVRVESVAGVITGMDIDAGGDRTHVTASYLATGKSEVTYEWRHERGGDDD